MASGWRRLLQARDAAGPNPAHLSLGQAISRHTVTKYLAMQDRLLRSQAQGREYTPSDRALGFHLDHTMYTTAAY
jgi:hypothetical protein